MKLSTIVACLSVMMRAGMAEDAHILELAMTKNNDVLALATTTVYVTVTTTVGEVTTTVEFGKNEDVATSKTYVTETKVDVSTVLSPSGASETLQVEETGRTGGDLISASETVTKEKTTTAEAPGSAATSQDGTRQTDPTSAASPTSLIDPVGLGPSIYFTSSNSTSISATDFSSLSNTLSHQYYVANATYTANETSASSSVNGTYAALSTSEYDDGATYNAPMLLAAIPLALYALAA